MFLLMVSTLLSVETQTMSIDSLSGASQRFLRKKQATLSFKWNDILNRRRDLNRSVSGYGYHESFRPQIHSYALVSLRYRFSLTKSKTDKNSHKHQNPNK